MDYLSKINKNTLVNGTSCHDQQQVTDFEHELIASLHKLKAKCNGYSVDLELAEHSIYNHHCNCIIGQNHVICKHIVAVILEYMQQSDLLRYNQYGWLNHITDNRLFFEIFHLLIDNKYWYKLNIHSDHIDVSTLNAECIEIIRSQHIEILNIFECYNEKLDTSTIAKISHLLSKFKALVALIEFISVYNLDKQHPNINFQAFLSYQEFILIAFNDHEYTLPMYCDDTKRIVVHAAKTSVGYLLHPEYKEAYYCIMNNRVAYFLVFIDHIRWFITDWDLIDQPNIVLKLNLRTSKSEIFQERLNAIKQQTLFHVDIQTNDNFVLATNEVSLTYDFEHQQCILSIESTDDKKIVNQYFYKQSHFYDLTTKSFKFNDDYHVCAIMKTLNKLQKMEHFSVHIDSVFKSLESFQVNYDFIINKQSLNLQLDINALDKVTQNQIFKAYNKKHKFFGLDKRLFDLETLDFSSLKTTVLNSQSKHLKINSEYAFNSCYLFFLETKFSSPILKKFVNDFSEDIKNYKLVSESFMPTLKSYQLYGVNWMVKILEITHGCILADEMGLGKTLQTICLLKHQIEIGENSPTLIIVPLSLINNWIDEFRKFWPEKNIIAITGNANERKKIISNINKNEIYLTTYNLVKNDINLINPHNFQNIILDEGQYIKNHKTVWTKYIKSIVTTNRIILSGTPIENNLMELWSIFDFIMPNYLPPLSKFKRSYCHSTTSEEKLQELALRVNPFILKRKKIDHLNLPTKHIEDIIIKMTNQEKEHYKQLFKQLKVKINVSTDDSGNIIKNRIEVLALITKLRQFCCSGELLNITTEKNTKFKILFDLIQKILANNNEAKIVIFSNFSSMLELLAQYLTSYGFIHLIMTGKNTSDERKDIINSFKLQKYSILLLSLKVGGVGLNLTMADHVIHYNPWWNESAELQATDRLHRIGQTKNVHVYRLLYENSIETDIQHLKQNKTNLIDKMINEISYNDLIKLLKNKIE